MESASERKMSVSGVAETTLPVAYAAPRVGPQSPSICERILTLEPSASGQSDAGAFWAGRGEAATKATMHSSLLTGNCSPSQVCDSR